MIISKETVFDRIEQSFILFKSNFLSLFLPIFIYNLIYFLVWYISFIKISTFWLSEIWRLSWLDFFWLLNNYVMHIAIGIVLFILYLMLYIPLELMLIKSIKQLFDWDRITVKLNLVYWFKKFFSSFTTYYYIFLYIAWIPAFLFIVWWIFFNLTFFIELDSIYKQISIWLMIFSLILFLFFSLYRWIRAKFSLLSAVDKDEFNIINFKKALTLSKNNWWRILWNLILIWIIVSIIKSIISWIISILGFFNSNIVENIGDTFLDKTLKWWSIHDLLNQENVNNIISSFLEFNLMYFIWDIIKVWLDSISIIFIIIFLYLLFKRLEFENNDIKTQIKKDNLIWNKKREL